VAKAAKVAPPKGAWIEITETDNLRHAERVAPPKGAWIEIPHCLSVPPAITPSRPPRARGLKCTGRQGKTAAPPVAPPKGAWIEIVALRVLTFSICGRAPQGRVD